MNKIKSKKTFIKKIKVSLLNQVKDLTKQEDPNVTFVFHDGSKKRQPLRPQFFKTADNRNKSTQDLTEDLKAISNDMGAKYFLI